MGDFILGVLLSAGSTIFVIVIHAILTADFSEYDAEQESIFQFLFKNKD